MDVNDLRTVVTVVGLVLFLVLWAWTWSHKRKAAHDEAAQLPFLGDELPEPTNPPDRRMP